MPTRLLVLGGSSFVGRAVVDDALARGWDVTTFNRGLSAVPVTDAGARPVDGRVTRIIGDRTDPTTLAPLRAGQWDLVLDTWAGAPTAARDAAAALVDRVGHYVYVSSCSVYGAPPPVGADESTATVDGDPDADTTDYPADKRGSELAIAAALRERCTFLRAGLILGPREDVGRLPWWLDRVARGGEVLAPGPPDTPLQLIDARDLAAFALDVPAAGVSGPVNTVSGRGHATMRELLDACVAATSGASTTSTRAVTTAELTWVDPAPILDAGIEPWNDLPIWIPPGHEYRGMHELDAGLAARAGLRCRSIAATVADTWAWMTTLSGPPPVRAGLPAPGIDRDRERAVLPAARA